MNEIKNITSGTRSLFAVLVLLMVASIVLVGMLLSTKDLEPASLHIGLIIFFCFLLLASLIAMIVILCCKPSLLFMRDISELQDQQGRLTKVASELGDKLTTTEQALMPILTGNDPDRTSRVKSGRIIIGSKDFAEQVIFGNLLVCWLEKEVPGIKVDKRIPNGSTMKNFADLKNGWIDGYVEYTGTGCWLLRMSEQKSVTKTINKLNERSGRFEVTWLNPLGTTNNYMVVVSKSLAKKMGLDDKKAKASGNELRIVDIQKVLKGSQKLTVCGPPETMNRSDSWAGLAQRYNLNSVGVKMVGYGDRYEALRTDYADITLGFETDPELDDADFVVLEDSLKFFPQYHSIPLFRTEALEEISGLKGALLKLADTKLVKSRVTDMIMDYKARGSDPDIAYGIAGRYVDEIRA